MRERTGVLDLPAPTDAPNERTDRWLCWILNNDVTPFDWVIAALMDATNCDMAEAYAETWEAHMFGKAVCHIADREECLRVAGIMHSVGVQTEVVREWE